ncbi:PAS domain S-box-containing protein [Halarchaeum rubridurum]|nr:PAS domain-containing sensor histidine kinase [Halarchaeum rubridurum]MBP1954392.1 PAS domain S-box-containing protein [Halarchaeum rubridurum]
MTNRIQLLVDDEGNRAALRSLLEQRYAVVVDDEGDLRDVDLHVVDDRTLPTYRDRLLEHSHAVHPTFAPTLLVRREDTRIDVDLSLPDADGGPAIVDDVVEAPVDKASLFRRLENLLVRRNQSIALARRYEESETRFEGLFQAIPDPAFVLDAERAITEVNDAFLDATGLTYAAVVDRRPDDLPVFDDDAVARLHDRLDATGSDGDGTSAAETLTYRDADGDTRHAELRVRNDTVAGEPTAVVVMHDVTAIHETNRQLEEFASIVTHDLRNPLQVAKARLPMVEPAVDEDAPAADHLDVIDGSLDRIDSLVDGVRSLVRETDVEERRPVAFRDVVERAWRTVETDDDAPVLDVDGEPTVEADPARLQQLLENLFRNAHDHGGDDVTVRVGLDDGGFYVADDGPGIPPEERADVLETGYTTSNDGTGLGLKIVSEIADAHGWDLTIAESAAGGARFEIGGVDVTDS